MTERTAAQDRWVVLGHVAGAHGVSGWVRIHSQTEPREAIFEYEPWALGEEREPVRVLQGRKHGSRLIALLDKADSREQAEALMGRSIAIQREQLPEPAAGHYYWADLEGLTVRLADGREMGVVERMLATGANDVMVVRGDRERLIPFVPGRYVTNVDLDGGVIVVDWDPEF